MINESVLVVDDDQNLRYLMSITLKRAGYQVVTAENGAEALKKIKLQEDDPFSVLITDQMMPVMDGIELLKKAKEFDPYLEVIVITAAGTLKTAISALKENGAFDYLLKPLESMSQLTNTVNNASAHRKLLLEREQLQNQIQADAQRLHSVVATSGDAILFGSNEDILKIVNPAAEALLGQTGLVGKKAQNYLPQALVSALNDWKAMGKDFPVVLEITWNDGSVQMVSLTPISEDIDHLQGWIMRLRDITHLKQLDKLRTKMLTDVANKIQTPLAQAMNTLFELNLLAVKDKQLAGLVSRLTQTWDRIQKWADELLKLIQIDSTEQLQLSELDLKQTLDLQEISQSLDITGKWGVGIELEISKDLPHVRGDDKLIRQLLRGLMIRAATRSKEGETVKITTRLIENQVWIDVSDQGEQVRDNDLPHIFDTAFATSSLNPELTGLELTLAKTAIDRMGGRIWIKRKATQGSTISICLPIVNE